MAAGTRPWTLEELHRLPDDGNKYELVFGESFVTPAPTNQHETVLARISQMLTVYVDKHNLGIVHHPRAVVRFQGSETEPDLFVRPGPALPNQDWDNAPAPLLVVEVLSPTTWRRDLGAKRKFYLAAGVAEYWVVDPEARDVRVIRPSAEDRVASERLTWAPSAVEPLVVSIPELFPG